MQTWLIQAFKTTAALAAVGLCTIAAAEAADLPLYAKAPAAPVVGYDWTGVYAGINGGGGFGHTCWSIVNALGATIDPAVGEGCHNADGGTVGGQIGYRWQKARWVFGLEGQGNWASFKGSNVSVALAPQTNQTRIDAFGLFTGQMGYTVNGLLLYGKAGAGVAHAKYETFFPGGVPVFNSVERTRWGYTLGIGMEWAFAENWSVGGEYNHVFLGHHTADFATVPGGALARSDRIGQDIDMGLIRVNYRWGGPVVVKY